MMKRFLLRILGFAGVVFLMLVVFVIYYVWLIKENHIYIDEYGHKESLLAETPSPRVIFLGGSNLAFGIDSKVVEDSVGLRPVNLGLQLGLGMRMMLSEAAEYCREGDILVISPEYEHFYGCAYGAHETLSLLTLLYPKITKYLNKNQAYVVLKGLPSAFLIMNSLFIQKLTGTKSDYYTYSSSYFNEYGDEERHWTWPQDKVEFTELHISDEFDEEYFEDFCNELDKFEARGIDVLIVPPSIDSKFYCEGVEQICCVEKRLREAGYPMAYEPRLSVYEREDMLDSSYHLAKSGIDKRMVLIIDALRNHLREAALRKKEVNKE